MTDHYSDYISVEEVSACCAAPILGLDDGLGHCADCGEWTEPAPVDLLELPESLPASVQAVLDLHFEQSQSGDAYLAAQNASQSLDKLGFCVDFGLDGVLYDLQPKGED